MKIKETPTALAILVFSWLIAIFGTLISVYIIIFKFGEFNALMKGFFILLGSLLLAAVIRMFANIGQILFDLKANMVENQKIFIASSCDLKDIKNGLMVLAQANKETREIIKQEIIRMSQALCGALSQNTKDTKEVLNQAVNGLNQSLSSELKAVNQGLSALSQNTKDTKDVLNQAVNGLNQSLSSELKAVNQGLSAHSQNNKETREIISQAIIKLNRDLAQNTFETKEAGVELQKAFVNNLGESKNVLEEINCDSEDMSQNIFQIKGSLEQLGSDIKGSLEQLGSDIKGSLEQLNCDSKDMSQSMHQIKTFFEQIERHLDLKE
jgi:DAD family